MSWIDCTLRIIGRVIFWFLPNIRLIQEACYFWSSWKNFLWKYN
jgi:hypothetical protein